MDDLIITVETTDVVKVNGKPVDFSKIILDKKKLDQQKINIQTDIDVLQSQANQIYATAPQAVPQEYIDAFNLTPTL